MSSNILVLKAKGLNTSPNELDREEGSLIEANNIIIRRDGVIEKIRGFKLWGTALQQETFRDKQILSYRNRILRHYSNTDNSINKIQYDNDGTGTFLDFNGSYKETEEGLRIKSVEANGNLYFTTSEGIKKISAKTSDDFTQSENYITQAGGIKAVDFQTSLVYDSGNTTGFFYQDSALLYRIVWAIKDNNNNLILGTPSQQQTIVNQLSNLLVADFVKFLSLLDSLNNPLSTTARIDNKDYVNSLKLTLGASYFDIRTNLINLCKKIDSDIFLVDGQSIPYINPKAPLTIQKAKIETDICTLTLDIDPTAYIATGKKVKISDLSLKDAPTATILNDVKEVTINSVNKTISFSIGTINEVTSLPSKGEDNQIYLIRDKSVQTFATLLELQANPGETEKLYKVTESELVYVWNGIEYVTSSLTEIVKTYVWLSTAFIKVHLYNSQLTTVDYANLTALEAVVGQSDVYYKTTDTQKIYTWDGTAYNEYKLITYSATKIYSAVYSSIIQPSDIPELPAVNQEWVALQDYLSNIQLTLLNEPTTIVQTTENYTDYTALNAITTKTIGTIYKTLDNNIRYKWDGTNFNSVTITTTSTNYTNISSFPTIGLTEIVYKAIDTGLKYLWNGTSYILTTVVQPVDSDSISSFQLTNSATVKLDITIPNGITTNYFYQVYRSDLAIASGTSSIESLSPDDELQLVYEAYPTSEEITNGQLTVIDSTPDDFKGANLYTNASTGEGILQANDIPPFAKDINRFKGYTFYSNTKTKQRLTLSLLGVVKLIEQIGTTIPTISICTKNEKSNTYEFVNGVKQQDSITITKTAEELDGKYFLLNSSNNSYYVWFFKSTGVDPLISGREGIKIVLSTSSAESVATTLRDQLSTLLFDFESVTSSTTKVTITNIKYEEISKIIDGNTECDFSTVVGKGEKITKQLTEISPVNGASYKSSGVADYFTLNSVDDKKRYCFWFKKGTATDPNLPNITSIPIEINGGEVISEVVDKISFLTPTEFTYTKTSTTITFQTKIYGKCTDSIESVSNSSFVLTTLVKGALNVLLSNEDSVGLAVEQTARSLIRVINKNELEVASAYYISDVNGVPGKMFFEGRELNADEFYVMTNNSNTGMEFNPDISPIVEGTTTLTSISGRTKIISTNHGLVDNDYVFIKTETTDPRIQGIYKVIYENVNEFSIEFETTYTTAVKVPYAKIKDVIVSENEVKPNRMYYSKYYQPEAVPIVNYFDVGAEEKPILRIFPLRDSLFVFKTDGLYRVSGEITPFSVALFDGSVNLLASDSICLVDNLLYSWTNQGIQVISESGTQTISRAIDNLILKLSSANYKHFNSATWGIGYGSDSSVTMWTILDVNSKVAQIGFRYNTLTNTWTTISKTPTCGIVFDYDNVMYLGPSDSNRIEQERKTFTRFDYSNREYDYYLDNNKYYGNVFKLTSTNNISVGSAVVQQQKLSINEFNLLLQKIDLDPYINETDYLSTLKVAHGNNLRNKIVSLAKKLDDNSNIKGSLLADTDTIKPLQISTVEIDSGICTISFSSGDARAYFSTNCKINLSGITPENGTFGEKIILDTVTSTSITFLTLASGAITLDNARVYQLDYEYQILDKANNITLITSGKTPTFTCENHGLLEGRKIKITSTTTTPNIDKEYIVKVIDKDTFQITDNIIIGSTSGLFFVVTEDFEDIAICYNNMVDKLNSDIGVKFTDYRQNNTTIIQEALVTNVNKLTNEITLNKTLDYVVGKIIVYDSIESSYTYSPNTFGDALNLKQIRQATVMMDSRALSKMTLEFKTDLKPAFIPVDFDLDGSGLFGHDDFGEKFFGGISNAAPIRTIIPMDCQRCRYIIVRFKHDIARENFQINGITLTGNIGLSERAYR